MLSKAQEHHASVRTQNEKDTDSVNKILAQQKKDREIL